MQTDSFTPFKTEIKISKNFKPLNLVHNSGQSYERNISLILTPNFVPIELEISMFY